MASEDKLIIKGNKPKWMYIVAGAVGFLIVLIAFVWVFGTPSAETVFKDMNVKMLQVKALTIDQTMTQSGPDSAGDISTKMYLNMSSASELKASGDFDMSIVSSGSPMAITGDVLKVGDSTFVKYSNISSSSSDLSASFAVVEEKLVNNWIKIRSSDQFGSIATGAVDFAVNIFPTPFANLTNEQRDKVVKMLHDDSTYNIEESAKVEIDGVSAYKYSLTYDKAQYKKIAKEINGYQGYLKNIDSDDSSEIKTLTVWVNISTRQIIKMEYTGTSNEGDVSGKLLFSGYDQIKTVDKPADYSIESELLN